MGSNLAWGGNLLFSPKHPSVFLYPPSLVFNGYRDPLPGVKRPVREVDLHFMPRLRMSGAIVYSHYILLRRGAKQHYIYVFYVCLFPLHRHYMTIIYVLWY
jgi:hypothetical protein